MAVRNAAHADRVVTLFSRQYGKFDAIAYGARLGKSRLGGALQPFAEVRLSLVVEPNSSVIKQCEVLTSLREIRENVTLIAYGAMLVELVNELWPLQQSDFAAYDTLLAGLNTLSRRNPRITALACGWQLVALAGFEPHLQECLVCGARMDGYSGAGFSSKQGGVVCAACRQSEPHFSESMAVLLSQLLQLNWQNPNQFTISAALLTAQECLFEDYVTHQLERPLKSLDFIRRVCTT